MKWQEKNIKEIRLCVKQWRLKCRFMGKKKLSDEEIKEVVGTKIDHLQVNEYLGYKNKQHLYKCTCDCGKEIIASRYRLVLEKINGKKSCGCIKKHGGTKTRLYIIWQGIKERCNCPLYNEYNNYGGRGIKYCDEWKDFSVFRDWALSHGYADNLTIERIDVNGNYEPKNCTWVTKKQQCRNKTDSRYEIINGQKKTLVEWCEIYNVPVSRVWARTNVLGWDIEKALTTPPNNNNRKKYEKTII